MTGTVVGGGTLGLVGLGKAVGVAMGSAEGELGESAVLVSSLGRRLGV